MTAVTAPAAPDTRAPQTTTTLTVRDLCAIITAVLPVTEPIDNDGWPSLPALRSVQLAAGGGVITATATNRYVLGHARKPATGGLPTLLIDRCAAGAVVAALTRLLADAAKTTLIEISVPAGGPAGPDNVTFTITGFGMTVPTVDASFPEIGPLIAAAPTRDTVSLQAPVGIHLRWLQALEPAVNLAGGAESLTTAKSPRFYFAGPDRPVRVEVGDWFVAFIMPTAGVSRPHRETPNVPFGLPNEPATDPVPGS